MNTHFNLKTFVFIFPNCFGLWYYDCAFFFFLSLGLVLRFFFGRLFEWDAVKGTDIQKLGLKLSDKALEKLEDVGQQLALNFNNEGSVLAIGGEVEITVFT